MATSKEVGKGGGAGGHSVVEATEPDDVMLEERAFVKPEDTRLLGGNQDLSELVVTMVERAKVNENTTDNLMAMVLKYAGIFLGFFFGYYASARQLPFPVPGAGLADLIPLLV